MWMRLHRLAVGKRSIRLPVATLMVVMATAHIARTQAQHYSYEGFGAVTQGAACSPDGFEVYHVTSLADSGPGTLRDGVSTGCRLIVFDVSGTIQLASHLYIRQSYLTIDGASAPAPGISIIQDPGVRFAIQNSPIQTAIHDIVVQYLRITGPGRYGDNSVLWGADILGIEGSGEGTYNVVLDHITASAARDGIFEIRNNVHDITISWCLIMNQRETMAIAADDVNTPRSNLSLHHNVWANNCERLPRVRYNTQTLDIVNNMFYQWDVACNGIGATQIALDSGSPLPSANIINNYYTSIEKPGYAIVYGSAVGPADDGGPPQRVEQGTVWPNSLMGQLYVSGNILPPQNYDHWSTRAIPLLIPEYAQVTTYPGHILYAQVVPFAGTWYPTDGEQQLLSEIIRATAIPADVDLDGDVDQDDLSLWQLCVTGPALGPPRPDCMPADFDRDNDVDQADFGLFQRCYRGSDIPADPDCME